jgi:hypothetical protein
MGLTLKQLKRKNEHLEKQLHAAELAALKADRARVLEESRRKQAVLRLGVVQDWVAGLRRSRLLRWVLGKGPVFRGREWWAEEWLMVEAERTREDCERRGAALFRKIVLKQLDDLIRTSSDPAGIKDRLQLLKFLRSEFAIVTVHPAPPKDFLDVLREHSGAGRRFALPEFYPGCPPDPHDLRAVDEFIPWRPPPCPIVGCTIPEHRGGA